MKRMKKSEADRILRSMLDDLENIIRKYDIELDDHAKLMLEKQTLDEITSSFHVYSDDRYFGIVGSPYSKELKRI